MINCKPHLLHLLCNGLLEDVIPTRRNFIDIEGPTSKDFSMAHALAIINRITSIGALYIYQ